MSFVQNIRARNPTLQPRQALFLIVMRRFRLFLEQCVQVQDQVQVRQHLEYLIFIKKYVTTYCTRAFSVLSLPEQNSIYLKGQLNDTRQYSLLAMMR